MTVPGAQAFVPLAPLTTLGVGGSARWLLDTDDIDHIVVALHNAREAGIPTLVLGGGSNIVVDDAGFDGLVVRLHSTRVTYEATDDGGAIVHADAGVVWDELVASMVARGLEGVEALSGIPGHVGAAPIQNIGAYGQELADHLVSVTAFDRQADRVVQLTPGECGFGYRTSHFKQAGPDAYVILRIALRATPDRGPIPLRYGDLQAHVGGDHAPNAQAVRDAVLAVRQSKGMVYRSDDADSHSVGSFFMNPIVDNATAERVSAYALDHGFGVCPCFAASPGMSKLSAAWLIERAGFSRGFTLGSAALSSRHVLAITNPGAATAHDIRALARRIQQGVRYFWDISLTPEARILSTTGTAPGWYAP